MHAQKEDLHQEHLHSENVAEYAEWTVVQAILKHENGHQKVGGNCVVGYALRNRSEYRSTDTRTLANSCTVDPIITPLIMT